jgi:hypothetical protein
MLKGDEDRLKDLKSGNVKVLVEHHRKESIEHKVGDPKFPQMLHYAIEETEGQIRSIKSDISIQEGIINNWKLRPLAYGEYSPKPFKSNLLSSKDR